MAASSSASTTSASDAQSMGKAGLVLQAFGVINSAIGSYYAAKTQQYQLESQALSLDYQKSISELNARQSELEAQTLLRAGEHQIGSLTMKAGKVKSSARAAMAANGIVLNEGSAAEVQATTDLMKEQDALTINSNAVRAAAAARTQSTSYSNQALLLGTSADNMRSSAGTISPFGSATTTLLSGGASVANSWYQDKKLDALLAAQKKD